MTTELIVLTALLATVNAAVNPAAVNPINGGDQYSFSYGVNDPSTGDVKDQHEQRVGDSVVGKYSVLESDGTKRVVEYTADSKSGYNAVVRKEGVAVHPLTAGVSHSLEKKAIATSYPGLLGNNVPVAGTSINPLAHGGHPMAYRSYANPSPYQTPVKPLAGRLGNPLVTGGRLNPHHRSYPGSQQGFGAYNSFNAHTRSLAAPNPLQVSYGIQHPLLHRNQAYNYAGYNPHYAGYANPAPYPGRASGLPFGDDARGPTSYANFNLAFNPNNYGTYSPHNQYAAPLPQGIVLPVPQPKSINGHNTRPKW